MDPRPAAGLAASKQLSISQEAHPSLTLVAAQQEGLCPRLPQLQRSHWVLAAQQAAAASLRAQQAAAACGREQRQRCPRLLERSGRHAICRKRQRKCICVCCAGPCLHGEHMQATIGCAGRGAAAAGIGGAQRHLRPGCRRRRQAQLRHGLASCMQLIDVLGLLAGVTVPWTSLQKSSAVKLSSGRERRCRCNSSGENALL